MSIEQIIWAVLISLFLGTLYHFYRLRKAIVNFWKIAKPDMSKEEVSKILDSLLNDRFNEGYVRTKLEHDFCEKITVSIKEMLEMGRDYTEAVRSMYEQISKVYGQDVAEKLFEDNMNELDNASKHIENLADIWPDIIRKVVVNKDE